MSVTLDWFNGVYILDAVEMDSAVDDDKGSFKYANSISFRLDGITYTAIENPEDGYRSCLGDILVNEVVITRNVFKPIKVNAVYSTASSSELLYLIDVETGEVVIKVGTLDSSGWYPMFITNYNPGAMITNKPAGWTVGDLGDYDYDSLCELMVRFTKLLDVLDESNNCVYHLYKHISNIIGVPYPKLTVGSGYVALPNALHGTMPALHRAVATGDNTKVHGMGDGRLQTVFYQLTKYKHNADELRWYNTTYLRPSENNSPAIGVALAAMTAVVPHELITFSRLRSEAAIIWLTSLIGFKYVVKGNAEIPIMQLSTQVNVPAFIEFLIAADDTALVSFTADLIKDEVSFMSYSDLVDTITDTLDGRHVYVERALENNLPRVLEAASKAYEVPYPTFEYAPEWVQLVSLILLKNRTGYINY